MLASACADVTVFSAVAVCVTLTLLAVTSVTPNVDGSTPLIISWTFPVSVITVAVGVVGTEDCVVGVVVGVAPVEPEEPVVTVVPLLVDDEVVDVEHAEAEQTLLQQ